MSDPISANAVGAVVSTAHELAVPVLADLVGLAGGDWLHQVRIRNVSRLEASTREILKQRGIENKFAEISPSFLEPAVKAAADETGEELLDLWARLIAAAADPKRTKTTRKSFVVLLQQFDPIDALVFREMWDTGTTIYQGGRALAFSQKLGVQQDAILASLENLSRLKCVSNPQGEVNPGDNAHLNATGRELARALFI